MPDEVALMLVPQVVRSYQVIKQHKSKVCIINYLEKVVYVK